MSECGLSVSHISSMVTLAVAYPHGSGFKHHCYSPSMNTAPYRGVACGPDVAQLLMCAHAARAFSDRSMHPWLFTGRCRCIIIINMSSSCQVLKPQFDAASLALPHLGQEAVTPAAHQRAAVQAPAQQVTSATTCSTSDAEASYPATTMRHY